MKGCGERIASSSAYNIADAVRLETAVRGRRFIRSGTVCGIVGESAPRCDCRRRWNSALVGVYDEDEGDEEDKMAILDVEGGIFAVCGEKGGGEKGGVRGSASSGRATLVASRVSGWVCVDGDSLWLSWTLARLCGAFFFLMFFFKQKRKE